MGPFPLGGMSEGLPEEVPCELVSRITGLWMVETMQEAHGSKRTEISKVVGLGSRESSDSEEVVQL